MNFRLSENQGHQGQLFNTVVNTTMHITLLVIAVH